MFKCKVCLAHQNHIDSLQAQISDLKAMCFPDAQRTLHFSPTQLEADAVLSGKTDTIDVGEDDFTSDQLKQLEDEQREAAAVLSGSY